MSVEYWSKPVFTYFFPLGKVRARIFVTCFVPIYKKKFPKRARNLFSNKPYYISIFIL